jgi:hypothetical protein
MTLDIEEGATIGGFNFAGPDLDAVINNASATLKNFTVSSNAGGRIVFNNLETGVVTGRTEIAAMMPGGEFIFNNAGVFTGANKSIKAEGSPTEDNPYRVTINNLATGVISSSGDGDKAIVVRSYVEIVNAGLIIVPDDDPEATEDGGEAIEYTSHHVNLHNLEGGWIEGSHHAYTGEDATTVINEAGGTMIGRNGSAVNIDNDASLESTVFVVNRGLMQGKSKGFEDSDGDAVDVDGRLDLENWGTIEGLGHNGYHNGEPNVSEAVAAGAATIVNHAGGKIYGYGRAIQIDNSGNEAAFAPTDIVNAGLIHGDGNLPTDVTPEEQALFAERIKGGEAINILGSFGDTLTNTGQIVGGVKMGGGDDIVLNKGTMTATGGSALDMGDGNDTLTNSGTITGNVLMGGDNDVFQGRNGSTVAGMVDGGDGNDSLTGGDGGDVLLGGVGNDTVKGGAGGDELSGGEGHDLLNGGQGNDTLSGGAGNDTMLGGAGEDVFVWAPGFGVDRIGDFGAGDQLDLSGFDFADGQAVIDAMFQQGGNVVLRIMDGEKLTLQNVQLADLDPNQFIVEGALLI